MSAPSNVSGWPLGGTYARLLSGETSLPGPPAVDAVPGCGERSGRRRPDCLAFIIPCCYASHRLYRCQGVVPAKDPAAVSAPFAASYQRACDVVTEIGNWSSARNTRASGRRTPGLRSPARPVPQVKWAWWWQKWTAAVAEGARSRNRSIGIRKVAPGGDYDRCRRSKRVAPVREGAGGRRSRRLQAVSTLRPAASSRPESRENAKIV
jgi:hypothetical protein